jgi:S1-C subfamily serine protease
MSTQFKDACPSCDGHIGYDHLWLGRTIPCPHCGRDHTLGSARIDGTNVDAPKKSQEAARIRTRRITAAVFALAAVSILVWAGETFVKQRSEVTKQRAAQQIAADRTQADLAIAEAEKAKAEAQLAKLKWDREEQQRTAAKAAADAEALAAANAAKQSAAETRRLEEEAKARVQKNPAIWSLWEEQDHNSIHLVSTHTWDATLNYKGKTITAKYEDLPDWLRTISRAKHKEDGEAKGLIREVNGKVYDLRTNPAGWLALPAAEVIQIVEDGYLLVDVASLNDYYSHAKIKVFKLKHNGLARVLNTGDRVQLNAMSVGTFTYQNKRYDVETVPVYDPGMPIGPLRERVVSMRGTATVKRREPRSTEPSKNGSGFFITEDGLFISNAHVVEDSSRIEVKTAAGKKPATVLRVDKEKDLALLRVTVPAGAISALTICTNKVSLGAPVFTIGYPLVELQGTRPKFTDGKISSLAGLRDDPEEIQISVAVQPGNSGGPLADANGDIVGVIVARLDDFRVIELAGAVPQNVNYAVKNTTLVRFLTENKDLAPSVKFGRSSQRTQEDAVHVVEKSSGLVFAYD